MRQNIFIFSLLFVFILFSTPCLSQTEAETGTESEKVQVIPLTVGDLQKLKDPENTDHFEFITEFYKKNKDRGATDAQILNELLKADVENGQNSELVKKLSLLGKRYKDIEHFFKNAFDEINMNILEKNPGRTDLLIDIDNTDTWKNIKHFDIVNTTFYQYLKIFQKSAYFSEIVSADNFSAILSSCANRGKGDILMSLILFPKDNAVFLTQKPGETYQNIQVDFSQSENLLFDEVFPPMEKVLTVNGEKMIGYDERIYLPFYTRLKNMNDTGIVKATVTATVCKDNVCNQETTPVIKYVTDKSTIEASSCMKIRQQMSLTPKAGMARVQLKNIYFDRIDEKQVDLLADFEIAWYFNTKASFIIKNEEGVLFSDPFVIQDGNDLHLKVRVLNPEALQENLNVVIDVEYAGKSAEFKKNVSFERPILTKFFSLFSFSILDFIVAFLSGIKFILLTPVLTALLLLGTQAAIINRKTSSKTLSFYYGLGKMFYFWCVVFFLLALIWNYILPNGLLYWGIQFISPLLNFIFILIFAICALYLFRIFDDVSVVMLSDKFPFFFSFFKAEEVREKAGMIVGFVTGALLLITPMTSFYYELYILLSRSPIIYSLTFAAGVSLPFLALSFLDKRGAALPEDKRAQKLIRMVLPFPLFFQILFLLLDILVGTSVNIFVLCFVLIVLSMSVVLKFPRFKRKYVLALLLVMASAFVSPFPEKNAFNAAWGIPFDEDMLRQKVYEGKSVYLNVTESFCLSCHWNRFLMYFAGAPKEIKDGKLTIMRIKYNHPFLKRLLEQSGKYGLPTNLAFSPVYPEGKLLDPVFSFLTMKSIVEEFLVSEENDVSDFQSELEENPPKPEEKDIN